MKITPTDVPRVFFDVNVLASALGRGGIPLRCLELVIEKRIDGATSQFCLQKLPDILRNKFWLTEDILQEQLDLLKRTLSVILPPEQVPSITGDAEDDVVLACAIAYRADYIISGDKKHLLPLGTFQGIYILTPRAFLIHIGVPVE